MQCKIRPWKLSDAPHLVPIIGNPNIQNNLRDGIPFPYTEEDAKAFIKAQLRCDPQAVFPFAVTVGGRLAGSVCVARQENIHFRTGELGYYIAEPYWGKGVCTSAVEQICRYVFENTDIIRIFAQPFAFNIASQRVLEKCGFQYEGTLKSNAVKHEKILDMKLYARIRTEL